MSEDRLETGWGCNHSGRIIDVDRGVIRCGCNHFSESLGEAVERLRDDLTMADERNLELQNTMTKMLTMATNRDATIATLRDILNPSGRVFSGKGGSPEADWYEETIFNEERLYESLGKEDARTVLYIWGRYRKAVEVLATAQEDGDDA